MRLRHLVWKELWHRKVATLILLLGITLCVALIVAIQSVSLGAVADLRRTMHRMGKNILILPRGLRLDRYWAGKFGHETLPQTDVGLLAKYAAEGKIPAGHFQGSLQRKLEIEGRELILCGLAAESAPLPAGVGTVVGRRPLETGEVELGSQAAQRLEIQGGDFLRLGPPPGLKVIRVREPTGTVQDFKVFVDIRVAQKQLGVSGVINVIEAMSFESAATDLPGLAEKIEERLTRATDEEARVRVYHFVSLARGRARAGRSTRHHAALLSALVFVFGLLIIGGYSVWQARARRREIGILLAVAARPKHVAWIFLQKMLILGVVGGVLGCWLGGVVAERGSPILAALRPAVWRLYGCAIGLALTLSVLPGLFGVAVASATDPAETLRER